MSTPAAQRRERILRAAVEIFAERGYAAASTAQIAAAAGASKETLYSYFGDKAGLLRAALASLVAAPQVPDAAPPVGEGMSAIRFERLLGQVARRLVADLMRPEYLGLARVVVAETPREPALADLFRDAVAGRALAGVAALLRAGQRHGLVERTVDVHAAARAFVGPLLTYVLLDGLLRPAGDIRSPAERAIARQVALFHRSISPDRQPERESP